MIPQGDTLSYFGAFLGGLLIGFSPCVYPLIPITLSFIGVESGTSWKKGLFFSLLYVSGIAVTYSVLGLVAALTGRLFGSIVMHPASQVFVGSAFIITGLSFLDVIRINFKGLNLGRDVIPNRGIFAIMGLGLVSGLAISPCVTPALGTILLYIASRQNIFYGVTLMFTFAYGMGFLLILSGLFGSLFFSLPKSGAWLLRLKRISGFIFLGTGGYFLFQVGMLIW